MSPAARLVTSAMKFSARFDCRRGRISRSPRMSSSVISATSAVSKPEFDAEHGERHLRRGSASASGHDATGVRLSSPCSASTCAMRSREPSLHSAMSDALAGGLQRLDVLVHRLEHVGAGLAALGGEVVAGVGADLDRVGACLPARERRQPRQRRRIQPRAPLALRRDKAGPAATAYTARRCRR